MSFKVVFRRIAKREFDDAISWYQVSHSPKTGQVNKI
jgi:hypothetical protein